jgi:hypothetical protein
MKAISLFSVLFFFGVFSASGQQHATLSRGTVFGKKPRAVSVLKSNEVETFMGKKTRISATIKGKVIKVTKSKGGWFEIDAGSGKIIEAHFKEYNVTLPAELKGHEIIAEGVAQKQFIADDLQHFAGDTVKGKKQHQVKTNPKQKLTFEVTGLIIE